MQKSSWGKKVRAITVRKIFHFYLRQGSLESDKAFYHSESYSRFLFACSSSQYVV